MARRGDLTQSGVPEAGIFGGAVVVIATLLVWWAVFANRLIDERADLAREHVALTVADAAARTDAIARLDDEVGRQKLMINSEGGLFGVMLLVLTGTLFVVARRRRQSSQRIVRLLQFTTHELKTPIAGVRALLQSLQLGSIPPEMQKRLLESGLLETNRLEHLAETILAFQRAASQSHLKPVRASSAQLIDDVIAHRKTTFGADEIVRGEAATHAEVLADRDAFRVVFENLLDNARKYGGGKVELSTSVHDAKFRIEVRDHGLGFDPGDAARLFEPFERDTTEGVAHGSGLGLYISRQLVRGMGGDLSARSDGKGKGATFVIDLPVAPAAQTGHEAVRV
jgi:signal transduction histidine kinase